MRSKIKVRGELWIKCMTQTRQVNHYNELKCAITDYGLGNDSKTEVNIPMYTGILII